MKYVSVIVEMDDHTAKVYDACVTGNDDDVLLAMEKAAKATLLKNQDYDVDDWGDDYSEERRLWVSAFVTDDGSVIA